MKSFLNFTFTRQTTKNILVVEQLEEHPQH